MLACPVPRPSLRPRRSRGPSPGTGACLWASLRAVLAGYTLLLSQVPDRAGTVDSLPFGTAAVHVREGAKPGPVSGSIVITETEIEAARKGRILVKQGDFTGAPEVKP